MKTLIYSQEDLDLILSLETEEKDEEIERLNNIINQARRILGKYKHYSTPTEQQNTENEDITDKTYQILHKNLKELKESGNNEKI